MTAQADDKHEIIIIRHGHGDHDEGHHGGVWKIAFADFMTAMMCFFLVMWLINAANEQTKAAVASYFNPVKLIDRNSSKKGLEDLGDGPHASGMVADAPPEASKAGENGRGNAGPATEAESSKSETAEKRSDEALFQNPFAVLSEIASETGVSQNVSAKGEGGAQLAGPSTGASGGESYRDPFAPDFWSQQVAASDTAQAGDAGASGEAKSGEQAAGEGEKPETAPKKEAATAEAMQVAEQIRKELAEALKGDKMAEGLTVVATDKGVAISVTDQLDFGMYEIGSAVPRREMVLAMEKIGQALKERHGNVTISGHTDGRPFRSENYDNWRLSTARAHSAYYMLLRGGVDEKRITEVSGYADRKLKVAADPLAAANRRIEILLEIDG